VWDGCSTSVRGCNRGCCGRDGVWDGCSRFRCSTERFRHGRDRVGNGRIGSLAVVTGSVRVVSGSVTGVHESVTVEIESVGEDIRRPAGACHCFPAVLPACALLTHSAPTVPPRFTIPGPPPSSPPGSLRHGPDQGKSGPGSPRGVWRLRGALARVPSTAILRLAGRTTGGRERGGAFACGESVISHSTENVNGEGRSKLLTEDVPLRTARESSNTSSADSRRFPVARWTGPPGIGRGGRSPPGAARRPE